MIRTFWGMSIAVFLWAGITQAQESSINTALTSNSTKMVLRVLDRVAGARQDQSVTAGEAFEIGHLKIIAEQCRYPITNPSGDAFVLLSITDQREERSLFRGWMIASSPALNAFDHPRYDVWPLSCVTESVETE